MTRTRSDRLALALALVVSASSCKRPAPTQAPAAPAVARVDGAPISLAMVQREVDRLRRGEREKADTSATPQELARAVLGSLVDRQVLAAQAKADQLVVSEADIQRATDALADDTQKAGESFPEHLAQDGETAALLHDETRERLLAERELAHALHVPQPDPAAIKEYAEAHRSEFTLPDEVHAQQILVASPEEAKSLLDQLRAGASFAALARKESLSPDARAGGDLGFFPRGVMPAPFDEICFSLKPGQLSGIVRSSYGFHIFKLLERRPAHRRTLEELAPGIGLRLLLEQRAEAERALLSALRAKATVVVDESQLAMIH